MLCSRESVENGTPIHPCVPPRFIVGSCPRSRTALQNINLPAIKPKIQTTAGGLYGVEFRPD